jgi:hypothetical protein
MNGLIHPMLATLVEEPFDRPGWPRLDMWLVNWANGGLHSFALVNRWAQSALGRN